jgi:hypothetical protein
MSELCFASKHRLTANGMREDSVLNAFLGRFHFETEVVAILLL